MSYDVGLGAVWVLLAYFFSIVFFFTGWFDSNALFVFYGLYFFIVGLCLNISNKLSFIVDVLTGADVRYEFMDDDGFVE